MIYHSFFKSTSQKCTNISSFNSRTSAFKIKKFSKILLKVSAEGMGRGKGQGNRESKVQNETWYLLQLLMSGQPEMQQKPSCRTYSAASQKRNTQFGKRAESQRCSEHLQHTVVSVCTPPVALSLDTKGRWVFQTKAWKFLNRLCVRSFTILQEEDWSETWSFHRNKPMSLLATVIHL